jgi:mRNA interferase RelE/StbE
LAWTIRYSETAKKQLEKLDRQIARRILDYMDERIGGEDVNPRALGKALRGNVYGDYWRYRVGDYRIICDIQDSDVSVLVIEIGNRRDVYR